MTNPVYQNPSVLDPYTLAYKAILTALQSWPLLMNLVGIGNFEDASTAGITTFRDLLTSGDTNSIKLLQSRSQESVFSTVNNKIDIAQDYPLIITTDMLQVVPINQVKWEVLRALVNKASYNLGYDWILYYKLAGGEDSTMTPLEQIAMAKRWAHVKTITVHMQFNLQDLR